MNNFKQLNHNLYFHKDSLEDVCKYHSGTKVKIIREGLRYTEFEFLDGRMIGYQRTIQNEFLSSIPQT